MQQATEPTCWDDIVQEDRARRMYDRGMLTRLPGTPEDETRYREQCRADARHAARSNEGDN